MLIRAITAFIALPGMVAFAIPIWVGHSSPLRYPWIALSVLLAGASLLLWCVHEFYVAGKGTLAPWSPPRQLVTTGPYRFCRNPMYVAVVTILLGWCLLWNLRTLIYYAVVTMCVFHLRVLFYEEPWAARTFGEEWRAYRERVPRWVL
jgi:protein-S-isoprenylcysteine O-methyltransferase Ste14